MTKRRISVKKGRLVLHTNKNFIRNWFIFVNWPIPEKKTGV